MSKYDRGYPYGDDYCEWKLGIGILAAVGLLYILPESFTTIAMLAYVVIVVILVLNGK